MKELERVPFLKFMSVFKTYTEKELSQMSDEDVLNLPFVVPHVHFQKNGDFVDARKVRKLQEDENGQLKELHKSGAARLKRGIMSFGFDFVFSLFVLPDGSEWLGDGHGRINLFSMQWPINTKGEKIYEFPCVRYPVKDKKEAARRLLHLTSQQNKVTQEGIDWMKATYEISDFEYDSFVNFDGVFDYGEEEPEEPKAKEDNYEEPDDITVDVVLGDFIEIGPHRLLCGDGTIIDNANKLIDGDRIDLVFTDPPYNIASDSTNFASNVSKAMNELKGSDWDKNFNIESALFVIRSVIPENCTVYIWTSHFLAPRIWGFFDDANFSNYLIWSKPNPMPSLSKRHPTWNTEICCYFTYGSKRIVNFPTKGHFLSCREVIKKSDGSHPTQKPIDLLSPIIKFNSNINSVIFDPFLGSGSTMVAAHQLNRKCYGMELDPKYCQVIIDRMQKLDDTLEVKINGKPYIKSKEIEKIENG